MQFNRFNSMLIEVDSSVTRILGSGESTKNKVGIQTGGFEGESQDAREILKFYTKFSSKNLIFNTYIMFTHRFESNF